MRFLVLLGNLDLVLYPAKLFSESPRVGVDVYSSVTDS